MRAIYYENAIKYKQDIQEVKDELFNVVFNGRDFTFICDDGNGDVWISEYTSLETRHERIDVNLIKKL